MHLRTFTAAILLAGAFTSMAGAVPRAADRGPSQAPSPSPPPSTDRIEDQITRAIAASQPGPEHQSLEPIVGSWNTDLTWYAPPLPPLHLTGQTENRWIIGGRFVLSEGTTGEGASRIEGMTVYGYDARERRYFAFGLNDLGAGYTQWSGTYDPRDRSFILNGKERDEATGAALVSRQQLKIESRDRYSLRVFLDLPGRPPLRVLEATFTRR